MFGDKDDTSEGLSSKGFEFPNDKNNIYVLYKRENEDDKILIENICDLFEKIYKDKTAFTEIIKNISLYLNNLKRNNKYYDLIFSNNNLYGKYDTTNEYSNFKNNIIDKINSIDIIHILLSFPSDHSYLYNTLLLVYEELNLIEIKNIYNVLFELTNFLIDRYDIYNDNLNSFELFDKFILNYELKYISNVQIHDIYEFLKNDNENYIIILLSLLNYCLNLIESINHFFCNENGKSLSLIDQLVVVKKEIYNNVCKIKYSNNNNNNNIIKDNSSNIHCQKKENEFVESNGLLINNIYYTENEKSKAYNEFFENCFSVEKETYSKGKVDMIKIDDEKINNCFFICEYDDNILLMRNCVNDNVEGMTLSIDIKHRFCHEIKLKYINLGMLNKIMCILLKGLKISQHLNEEICKKTLYVFSNVITDIIKKFYKKNENLLFLDIFFTNILKTTRELVQFYNGQIERSPKQTMLFYKCFNKIIDQISIFLHNKVCFKKIYYGNKDLNINYKNVEKYLYHFDETYYMLFYLFYVIIELANEINNNIFLFFICLINYKCEKEEDEHDVNNLNKKEDIPFFDVKEIFLNSDFINSCKEKMKEKNINRMITIFLFLEKKIKNFFSYFKFIFCYVWEKYSITKLEKIEADQSKGDKKKQFKIRTNFENILKKIKYVLLDMFVKYTKLLVIYKYYFIPYINNTNDHVGIFFGEFMLYMKSVEKLIFLIFPNCSNKIINKLEKYTKHMHKICENKLSGKIQDFVKFNENLYEYNKTKNNNNFHIKEKKFNNYEENDNYKHEIDGDNNSHGINSQILQSTKYKTSMWCIKKDKKFEQINNYISYEIILLNIFGIIYANILEEIYENKYKFIYFKNSIIHFEFLKKLKTAMIKEFDKDTNVFNEITEKIYNDKFKEKKNYNYYFCFPYELLALLINFQLKFFMNNILNNYKICTIVIEFIFYISSTINPYFFKISKHIWGILGSYINLNIDHISLLALTNIFFHLILDKTNIDIDIVGTFENIPNSSSKQYFLYLFLKNQTFLNENGKNYLFFLQCILRNINSEELIEIVMKIFYSKLHIKLQYTLNILLEYLNSYSRCVIKMENEMNIEIDEKFCNNKINDNENKIISIFIYLDVINIFPENFLDILNDLQLKKDILNMFNFFIYLNNEFSLLAKRYEIYKYDKIFKKIIKINGKENLDNKNNEEMQIKNITDDKNIYYNNKPKIYFPILISSLISYSLFYILKNYTFSIQKNVIIDFYKNFFSDKYLYTLCNNYIYVKILNESFIIFMYIKKIIKETNIDNHNNDIPIQSIELNCLLEKNDINNNLKILSSFYKVYIIFFKQYPHIFIFSIIFLIKNNIITLTNESEFSDFYNQICNDVNKDDKYSSFFKNLIFSILNSFFFENRKINDLTIVKENYFNENINLVTMARQHFLNSFFQSKQFSDISKDHLKNTISKFFQTNFKKYNFCENDISNLVNFLLPNMQL
ncbi:conserved Plasmodium protein, unknown function [Plasmodium berghei]|uniref:Uncharacterized protein n=2 Tax=Plasmodium berghei TaxID=5821 RepID=A0A509AKP8_PLABA|nr:conserved Plasmodium protein, unknown function [Plasmodium berghei ANKA]SCM21282.1 conserved Plasmodium protein, unknown function [Plasmodium berghei]SCN24570.1 conserved Plasmodium protein, unknown function [Plasmodium berghei]SCO60970.1 conserved Plasmodium protein, unknown function [Plasmodium berghei]VUC55372.1 conserved Plasmodium protein, unknown function [Plasmodium berghei ANKA]|eukprot:XP_034421185.1 conserved Plasmodium protein, unknown function [Plasmodium berghei ANKA]